MICIAIFGGATSSAQAAERPPANVPPTLEIEVLDPNADSQGRPAVELNRDEGGNLVVDIPPVVLVHRYYYTGDRSFQAQLLPGGPSIVVANHPRTGERCYIQVQMMPGAPRVTYTKHGIEYDFGKHAVSVCFGLIGPPSVKYRNGVSWSKKVAHVLHTEEFQEHSQQISAHTKDVAARSHKVMKGAFVEVAETAKIVVLPVQNTLQVLPFGKVLFSGELGSQLSQKADEHERNKQKRHAERENVRNAATYKTNR